ncbi:MAG: hypothetical protein FK734_11020, partial [Asgard group archaeon]|nr:hypothetical protein [Asgard group archaeon]
MSIRKYYYINNLLIGIILITLIQVPFFNQNLTNNTSEELVVNKEITSYNCNLTSNTKSSIYPQAIFNDIASASILCYLHLITTQVQLDINFVGSNSLIESSSEVKTVLEEIVIFSKIRSVQVVESDAINLDHTELFVGNITYIQFQLSSEIPIGVLRNVKITFIQDTYDFLTHYNYILGVNWQRLIGNQNVAIICDMGGSLLECKPLPHSITTVSNKLVLSWL